METWHQLPGERVLEQMEASLTGLSAAEAKDRLERYGANELVEEKRKSFLQVFLSQFCDLMVLILIIAAAISAVSGNPESTVVIIVVLILNAIMGTVQYSKAEKSLASLKDLSSPTARVLRDGVKVEVDSKEIVPGDLLVLEAGDLVVADGRILQNFSLQVNESSLTGESTNVEKDEAPIDGEPALGDRFNMVYSGSLVTYGRAEVVVTATGMSTEMGKIAGLMNSTKEKKTPLQASLDQFSSRLAAVIMVISVLVFFLSLRQSGILDALLFAVALAVAAIPEALGSIVTIVQAMGTQKMARENAIIKDLKAVESLGCVSVICSDKTGTLTQNRMTVREIYAGGSVFSPDRLDRNSVLDRYLVCNAVLNNDSNVVDGQGVGDPTEFALLVMTDGVHKDFETIRAENPRLEEIPFDSDRKLMSSRYHIDGRDIVFTKGALDVMLDRTVRILDRDGERPITPKDRETITEQNRVFSENGLRVLTFGYREIADGEALTVENETGFTFLGLISMIDPPREESAQAVSDACRAGIRPVMITGDHRITATAIAKQIGIFRDGDMALTGVELDAMPEEEFDRNIEKISVYARVSPENKIRIVDAWQRKGRIVSMTGDGVNDAPALKKADIGVAMGITGTGVSKDAASMILADDNFATIIKAVANGRNVYRNIKNAIGYLLSGNMAGIFAVLYTSLAGLPIPFMAVHLLFINLVTDSLPALAIGMEQPERDLLSAKPRDPNEGILTKGFSVQIVLQGALIAVCTMAAYHLGLNVSHGAAMTMAFATLSLARLFHGFNCRSGHSIFRIGLWSNPYSIGAFFAGAALLAAVVLIPAFRGVFTIAALTAAQLGTIVLLAFVPTAAIQIVRIIREAKG